MLTLEKVLYNNIKYDKLVSFIAPLDNLMWDRVLIRELFNFEYKWEVYTPIKDRKYGYYVLPVLYKDEFIGRFEPIANKKLKQLEVINWWFEDNVKITDDLINKIAFSLKHFIRYLNVSKIKIRCKNRFIKGIELLIHKV